MNEYKFQNIESKWQKHWSDNNSIKCDINSKEKNGEPVGQVRSFPTSPM